MQVFDNRRLGALARSFILLLLSVVYISEARSLNGDKNSDTESLLPSNLTLNFLLYGTPVTLSLNMNQNCSSTDVPVMIGIRGRMMNWTAPNGKVYATYVDETRQASIVASIGMSTRNSTTRIYFGSFSINGQRYTLTPQSSDNMTSVDSANNMTFVTIEGLNYGISVSQLNLNLPTIGESRMSTVDFAPESLLESMMRKDNPVDLSSKQEYTVEVLLVADYSIYYKWYILSKATTDQGRSNDAIANIQYYFAHVLNGINSRYAGIIVSDFSIRVKLVGYFIAMTPADSPWTEGMDVKEGDGFLVYQGLNKLQDWVKNMKSQLPMFDSAMLYSGNNLWVRDDNGNKYRISGLANIEAVCNYQSVSISLDGGEYASIETGAHELGHNLGAQHDGISDPKGVVSNTCNGNDFFIMSPAPGNLDNNNFKNPFNFSSCSVQYFRTYLASVTAKMTNCLLTINNPNPVDTTQFFTTYPGQRYNVNQQCQLLWGSSSFYCAGGSNDKILCKQLDCWDSASSRCVTTTTQRAADGTTCASGSWCMSGECTVNAQAPRTKDTCLYGDYRGRFNYSPPFTCETVGSSEQWRCYESSFMTECCDTCAKIVHSTTGCEFGDRSPDYCRTQLSSGDCYHDIINSICCATCAKFRTTNPTCLYGDHQPSCRKMTPEQCYGNSELCCDTCSRFKTGMQGCEYGDKAPWCSTYVQGAAQCQQQEVLSTCCKTCAPYINRPVVPNTSAAPACTDKADWCSSSISSNHGYCYDSSTQTTCCDSCRRVNTGQPRCQYGNKFTWCKKEYCTQNAQECCAVCS